MKPILYFCFTVICACSCSKRNSNSSLSQPSPTPASHAVFIDDSYYPDGRPRPGGISIVLTEHNNRISVYSTLPGGAAEKAGLVTGDELLQIDSTNLQGKDKQFALALLRGLSGTKVKVTFQRESQQSPQTIEITRDSLRVITSP